MAEDLKFELAILATVQGFYQKLLRDSLGGDVPIPSGLDEVSLRHSEGDLPETLSRMYRWLHVLDMAISPAMMRQKRQLGSVIASSPVRSLGGNDTTQLPVWKSSQE